MSIETYETIAETYYDKDGNLVCRYDLDSEEECDIPESATKVRTIVNANGKELEVDIAMSFDWKESPDDVVSQVNEVLESFGLGIEFVEIIRGDDTYYFSVIDLNS